MGSFADTARFEPCAEPDHARAGGQHAKPVSGHIPCHAGSLLIGGQALHAIGIDHDVLRGGSNGNQESAKADHKGARDGITRSQENNGPHQRELGR